MNKSGLCVKLRNLGYDCVLQAFPAAELFVIRQNGMTHILCSDEAEKLSHQLGVLDLYSCLVYCEGAQWYEIEPPMYLTPMSVYHLRSRGLWP